MDLNETSLCMDVKLDIYDKRPESLKFKAWTRCLVKIEAIKCLPCFLRITIQALQTASGDEHSPPQQQQQQQQLDDPALLCVSINVPGVTISLATSRTKQYSYGLFWTHNRRDCFIYFAADTDAGCRKHMKWIRKSIKNLEVYRHVFLEQRRNSRSSALFTAVGADKKNKQKELSAIKDALSALGPLPEIPVSNSNSNTVQRVSRVSDIYEEIFEGHLPPRLSRRFSRASIASGIYEEMKPCSQSVVDAILEEQMESPPPLPPLPPHRKRINTFESDAYSGSLGDIPRSNTTPEVELVKKKKYKNVLDNLFGSGRSSKRSESVSESQACTIADIINGGNTASCNLGNHVYANDILRRTDPSAINSNNRNSFSSPDLSKINFLDTFDEEKVADLLLLHKCNDDLEELDVDLENMIVLAAAGDHNVSSISLDDSAIGLSATRAIVKRIHALKSKAGSMESLNISEQLPQNFNFSACNTSSINLVGSSGAVPSIQNLKKNKILMEDDLTGYCIMAPIKCKKTDSQQTVTTATSSTTSSTSSGYSTGSYCSTTSASSSNTNSSELHKDLKQDELKYEKHLQTQTLQLENDYDLLPLRKTPIPVTEQLPESMNIYENMQSTGSPLNCSVILRPHDNTPPLGKDFTGNLYENLLTIKAAQELEQPLPAKICTSTPTESSGEKDASGISIVEEQEENYYQTPRKSFVSVDDKIPSYYPNSCDTIKMKRASMSPTKHVIATAVLSRGPAAAGEIDKEKTVNNLGLKHLVNIKLNRERKENLYISSPQKIIEQRNKNAQSIGKTTRSSSSSSSTSSSSSSSKHRRSQNAKKISENVYTVNLKNKKSCSSTSLMLNNNNNNTEKFSYNDETAEVAPSNEKLKTELLQLALLQNIDFKFDDAKESPANSLSSGSSTKSPSYNCSPSVVTNVYPKQSGIRKLEEAELEYENCYRATKDATRLLHKYATLAPKQSMRIKQQLQHHLQIPNAQEIMTQSTKTDSPSSVGGGGGGGGNDATTPGEALSSKKFASLPRFKKIDFSPLKLKINNVLQRNHQPDF